MCIEGKFNHVPRHRLSQQSVEFLYLTTQVGWLSVIQPYYNRPFPFISVHEIAAARQLARNATYRSVEILTFKNLIVQFKRNHISYPCGKMKNFEVFQRVTAETHIFVFLKCESRVSIELQQQFYEGKPVDSLILSKLIWDCRAASCNYPVALLCIWSKHCSPTLIRALLRISEKKICHGTDLVAMFRKFDSSFGTLGSTSQWYREFRFKIYFSTLRIGYRFIEFGR